MFKYPEIDLSTAGENGYVTIEPTVEGFWSSPVTLRISRNWYGEDKWNYEISHSSGGYEGDNDRMKAEHNFAMCILEGIKLLEELKTKEEIFERNYKRYQDELEAARAVREKEKLQRLEKDPGFTKEQAEAIVLEMMAELKVNNHAKTRQFYFRDSDKKFKVYAEKWDKTVFKEASFNHRRLSKKSLIEMLVNGVSRNRVVEESNA